MAVEIPLRSKYRHVTNGTHKSTGGSSSVKKHRGLTGKAKEEAQRQTSRGAKVLVLVDGRKRRFELLNVK
jgi:hypothetical protein